MEGNKSSKSNKPSWGGVYAFIGCLSAVTTLLAFVGIHPFNADAAQHKAEQAKQDVIEQARQAAIEQEKQTAIAKAKQEVIERAKREAIEQAKQEALERAKQEARERAKREANEQAKQASRIRTELQSYYQHIDEETVGGNPEAVFARMADNCVTQMNGGQETTVAKAKLGLREFEVALHKQGVTSSVTQINTSIEDFTLQNSNTALVRTISHETIETRVQNVNPQTTNSTEIVDATWEKINGDWFMTRTNIVSRSP